MAFTKVTVNLDFRSPDDSEPTGVVSFQLTHQMSNNGVTATRDTVQARVAGGVGSITLYANDDEDTTPLGIGYRVTVALTGAAVERYTVVIPSSATTVDLADLLPAAEVDPTAGYASVAQLNALNNNLSGTIATQGGRIATLESVPAVTWSNIASKPAVVAAGATQAAARESIGITGDLGVTIGSDEPVELTPGSFYLQTGA